MSVEPKPPIRVNMNRFNNELDIIKPIRYIIKSKTPNLTIEYVDSRSDAKPAGIILIDEEAANAPTRKPTPLSEMEMDLK
ncbi:MAG: hypothetical protein A2889_10820 [Nitrospinae bacterium RIFCSPLOWO2_01_FULL_39_10]|nr:MAG: hypothetical protein A2889_10820 [Nitrospinae bacterium RIFCSPLOWO2_01_FULL_39_10]